MSDAGAEQDRPLPVIPDHHLVRIIGKGSYGEVWLARNVFGVFRAIKIVRRNDFKDDGPFRREVNGIRAFEPLSRSHPAFVAILHVGESVEHSFFYYVMELGDDQAGGQQVVPEHYQAKTLATELNTRGKLPVAECIRIGLRIADGLSVLHNAKLVHRDIKPANIIFVNGQPKLADIGLVNTIDDAATFVGTHGYIPPEGPGSPQGDIFALGKLLYELSTGKDRQQFPALPTVAGETVDSAQFIELNEVLIRACDSDKRRRYATAEQLYNELQLIDQGRSLRRLRVLERRSKLLGRLTVALVIAGALGALGFWQIERVRRARAGQAAMSVAYGARLAEQRDVHGALPWFVDALQAEGEDENSLSPSAVTHRTRIGTMLQYGPQLVSCWWQPEAVYSVGYTPDGRRIATGDVRGGIRVLDATTGALEQEYQLSPTNHVVGVHFHPHLSRLAAADDSGNIGVWDLEGRTNVMRMHAGADLYSIEFSPDGKWILTAGLTKHVQLWDARTGERVHAFIGHTDDVRSAVFDRTGTRILTAAHDEYGIMWDPFTGQELRRFHPGGWLYTATFSPDGKRIACGGSGNVVQIYDTETGFPIEAPLRLRMNPCFMRFSPDGRLLASAAYDSGVYVWNLAQHGALAGVLHHQAGVWSLAFSPDGRRLVTVSVDKTVRTWELPPPVCPRVETQFVSKNGERVVSFATNEVVVRAAANSNVTARFDAGYAVERVIANDDGTIVMAVPAMESEVALATGLDTRTGQHLRLPSSAARQRLLIAEDGRCALSFTNTTVETWNLRTGERLMRWERKRPVENALLSHNGRMALLWGPQFPIDPDGDLIDTETGVEIARLSHALSVSSAAFSVDDEILITGCFDYTITPGYAQMWSTRDGKEIGPKLGHADGIKSVALSPNGRYAATGGEDYIAQVWDLKTGKHFPPLFHENQINSVAFTPDSRWLVTGSGDSAARVWDVETSTPLSPILRHEDVVGQVAWLMGGRGIATRAGAITRWFDLPMERSSLPRLKVISRFLAGEAIESKEEQDVITAWARENATRCAEIDEVAWHREQWRRCQAAANLYGAHLHAKELLRLGESDTRTLLRIAESEARFEAWEGAAACYDRAEGVTNANPDVAADAIFAHLLAGNTNSVTEAAVRILQSPSLRKVQRDSSLWALAAAAYATGMETRNELALRLVETKKDDESRCIAAWLRGQMDEPLTETLGRKANNATAARRQLAAAIVLARVGRIAEAEELIAATAPVVPSAKPWQAKASLLVLEKMARAALGRN